MLLYPLQCSRCILQAHSHTCGTRPSQDCTPRLKSRRKEVLWRESVVNGQHAQACQCYEMLRAKSLARGEGHKYLLVTSPTISDHHRKLTILVHIMHHQHHATDMFDKAELILSCLGLSGSSLLEHATLHIWTMNT